MNLLQAYDDSGSGSDSDSNENKDESQQQKPQSKPFDGLAKLLAKRKRQDELSDQESDESEEDIMALARKNYLKETLKRARLEPAS